ncbi:hypothetical protein ACQKJZ_14015 [Sphingomonas sp. NPDC019816]|uniref:hypothetical protein n=1 Tax=unclassified Sphingomonas TaxID=196159 RepID=UPI00289F40CD|nr:hypothetical protein [Sphingomonas sp.]
MARPGPNLIPAALTMLATPILIGAGDAPSQIQYAQVTIRERVILRVPRTTMPAVTASQWKERKGPRCINAQQLAGALPGEPGTVDIVLIGGKRVRARLSRACRQIDYYSSFYIRPGTDGMICAGREPIRTRGGAVCEIDKFRALTPR